MANNGTRLYTVKEIASIYGIKPQTLYLWVRYKKFPFIKVNKNIFIRPEVFNQFLENNTVEGR